MEARLEDEGERLTELRAHPNQASRIRARNITVGRRSELSFWRELHVPHNHRETKPTRAVDRLCTQHHHMETKRANPHDCQSETASPTPPEPPASSSRQKTGKPTEGNEGSVLAFAIYMKRFKTPVAFG